MSVQKSYNYFAAKGVAGGLFDLSPHRVDSRVNGETVPGAMKFGMGAVQGEKPGTNVLLPDNDSTADVFEGLVLTGHTTEMSDDGKVRLQKFQTVGILRWGKAWALVASDAAPSYGEQLYLVINEGDDRGKFTNVAENNLPINGRFVGDSGNGGIAPVEIFAQIS